MPNTQRHLSNPRSYPVLPAAGHLDGVSLYAEPPRDHPAHNNKPLITTLTTLPNKGTDGNIVKGTDQTIVRGTGEDNVGGSSRALHPVDLTTLLARLPELSRDNSSSSTPSESTPSTCRSVLAINNRATASRSSARAGLLVAPTAGLTTAETAAEEDRGRSGPSGLDHRATITNRNSDNNRNHNISTNNNSTANISNSINTVNSITSSVSRTGANGNLSNNGDRGMVSGGAVS